MGLEGSSLSRGYNITRYVAFDKWGLIENNVYILRGGGSMVGRQELRGKLARKRT